jgi:hypothetical protein
MEKAETGKGREKEIKRETGIVKRETGNIRQTDRQTD